MRAAALLLVLLLVVPAASHAGTRVGFAAPAAAVSGGAEPSILVARDGVIWIGDTSGLVRSTDGVAWTRMSIPFLGGLFADGWALAEDDVGRIYVAVTQGQVISVASTMDDGATWRVSHVVDVSTLADRPWIAARGDGEVAVVYNDLKTTRELCLHSTDAGLTFLTRYVGLQSNPNAGNLVFGPDGSLTFGVNNLYRWNVPCVGEPRQMANLPSGAQIFHQVQVDAHGDVYTARPSPDNGAMRLLGTHGFSSATRRVVVVSPPDARSNTFATLSANGDEVVVAWYASTSPGDPSATGFQGTWDVHLARVTDFWGTPQVTRQIVQTGNHVGGFCMSGIACTSGDRDLLDYFMVDHGPDGSVHVAYGHDGATRRAEVRYAHVP